MSKPGVEHTQVKTFLVRACLDRDLRVPVDEGARSKGAWDIHIIMNVDAETVREAIDIAELWLEGYYKIYTVDEVTD